MEFIQISKIPKFEGKKVKVRGWIHRQRSGKQMAFIVLRDSSGLVQCTFKSDSTDFQKATELLVESSCIIEGTVAKDERAPGGFEIKADSIEVIHSAERFPITKDQSTEFLLDQRHLWVRSQKMTAIWKIRSTVFGAIHEFFRKREYFETHSPFITRTSESGLEMFEVDYFGQSVRLAQTWQFYAEAMIHSLEKIYTIAPSFRAEKSSTSRHLTEYWHTEMEVAWMDLDGLAKEAEELISFIVKKVLEKRQEELKILKRDIEPLKKITTPFPKITYTKAIEILKKDGMEITWGKDLRTLEEKQLMTHYEKPLIVTHYPKEIMAFYKPSDPEDPKTARCLDVLVPEAGFEVIGGSERDLDIEEMKKVLKEKGEDIKDYEWYFDLRRYGAVPHSGFGMGTDRIVQWICGLDSIKDAIPFPRTMERTTP